MTTLLRKITVFFILVFCCYSSRPQTIITGKVTDATTHDAVPFAGILIKGTSTGTTSDFEGNYNLRAGYTGDSIIVQMMGYISKTKAFTKGKKNIIDIQLMPSSFQLQTVTILPGENPAFKIIRSVWANKYKNNKDKLGAYQYNCYTKVEISANNIDNFSKTQLMKPFHKLFDSIQVAAGEDGQMVLPLFMSENISEVYALKSPQRNKEIIKASKLTGVGIDESQLFTQYAGSTFQEYNFYTNWLNIFQKDFVSPISNDGMNFYIYRLTDTVVLDGKYCFEIQVRPKHEEDLAFTGTIWINDTTFALKRVILEVGKKANINFVNRFKIQQDLVQLGDSVWMPLKTRVLVSITPPTKKALGMLGKFYTSNRDFVIGQPKDLKFYEDKMELAPGYSDHSKKYWDTINPEKLTNIDRHIYNVIDSLKYIPKVKTYIDVAKIIVNGYFKLKKFELGPYILVYGFNAVEGNRFRAGFRSTVDFSKSWVVNGYLAYGTKDEKLKYCGTIERFISREWWTKVGIQYKYDIVGMGMSDDLYESNTIFAASSQLGLFTEMNEVKYARFWFESDLGHGFSQKIDFDVKYFKPLGDLYFAYYKNGDTNNVKTDFYTTEINFITRWAPREIMLVDNNNRVSMSSSARPVLTFQYTFGIPNMLGSDFSFHKFSLNISQSVKLGLLGRFNYSVTGTKYLGGVPYPMLNILPGNETFVRTTDNYNLMNFFEFVTDQSLEIRVTQFFNGYFFNRVPLLKRLKLREVLGGNIVFGSMDPENIDILPKFVALTKYENGILTQYRQPTTQFNTLSIDKPYVEVFVGVENILRFIRIDFFSRLTYLTTIDPNGNAVPAPKFGIKGTLYFSL